MVVLLGRLHKPPQFIENYADFKKSRNPIGHMSVSTAGFHLS